MANAFWKLSALAVVMAAGFLVVYQVQQSLDLTQQHPKSADFESPDATDAATPVDPVDDPQPTLADAPQQINPFASPRDGANDPQPTLATGFADAGAHRDSPPQHPQASVDINPFASMDRVEATPNNEPTPQGNETRRAIVGHTYFPSGGRNANPNAQPREPQLAVADDPQPVAEPAGDFNPFARDTETKTADADATPAPQPERAAKPPIDFAAMATVPLEYGQEEPTQVESASPFFGAQDDPADDAPPQTEEVAAPATPEAQTIAERGRRLMTIPIGNRESTDDDREQTEAPGRVMLTQLSEPVEPEAIESTELLLLIPPSPDATSGRPSSLPPSSTTPSSTTPFDRSERLIDQVSGEQTANEQPDPFLPQPASEYVASGEPNLFAGVTPPAPAEEAEPDRLAQFEPEQTEPNQFQPGPFDSTPSEPPPSQLPPSQLPPSRMPQSESDAGLPGLPPASFSSATDESRPRSIPAGADVPMPGPFDPFADDEAPAPINAAATNATAEATRRPSTIPRQPAQTEPEPFIMQLDASDADAGAKPEAITADATLPADEPTETPNMLDQPERESRSIPAPFESTDETANEPQPLPGRSDNAGAMTEEELRGDGTIDQASLVASMRPELKIEKRAPEHAELGQPLIYEIRVTNAGQMAANKVVVEDRIPRGTTLEGTIPQAEMTNKRLVWKLGHMESGAEKIIKVKVVPTSAGEVGSIATVSFVSEVGSTTTIRAPQLDLTMEGPAEVRLGEEAEYRFTMSNIGTGDATGVFVRSLIPIGLFHDGGKDLEYELGTLPAGETRTIDLPLKAIEAGEFVNRATLHADGDLSDSDQANIRVLASRLSITRNGPKRRFVDRPAEFTNTVRNTSSQLLRNVQVVEHLPEGAVFDSAGDGGQYDARQRTVTWMISSLGPNDTKDLKTTMRGQSTGELLSTVRATDGRGDEAQVALAMQVSGFSSLTAELTHAGRPVAVGEKLALRFIVKNKGTAGADNVWTTFELPESLQFVAARGPSEFDQDGQTVTFRPVPQLAINAEKSYDLVVMAAKSGSTHVRVGLASDQLDRPIHQEEAVVIFDDNE